MSIDWIARHALPLWASLLVVALGLGDLGWWLAARRRQRNEARGRQHNALPALPGLAIALTLALAFAAVAAAVVHGNTRLHGIDHQLAAGLRADLPTAALRWIGRLTQLGNPWLLAVIAALVSLALLRARHIALTLGWIGTLAGTALVNTGLKFAFQRQRPPHEAGLVGETSFSFPSGHASGSVVFYGMAAYLLLRLLPMRWHRPVIMTAVALITTVGISRVLLQVHYLSDVLAGYVSGLAWLALCIGAAEYLRLRPPRPLDPH